MPATGAAIQLVMSEVLFALGLHLLDHLHLTPAQAGLAHPPFIIVPLTTTIVGAAPAGTGGVVGGLFNSVRQVGGALGSAVLGRLAATAGAGQPSPWRPWCWPGSALFSVPRLRRGCCRRYGSASTTPDLRSVP
ncbi:hypothetical protein SAMN05216275_106122 [Streptosporangium canum]|uniref:Major Facilitator Superfamily protein n=1 Tax=Streptosporangium canum TaxID=324952 RepID=A0A1I3N6D2_9ACTN|nr:MFS transporter [Streptosporangium canum]SFJ04645.1 hypothetical protein SAMN05216275_106122 [Streptosporangium canum]